MGNKAISKLEMTLHWIVGIGMIAAISVGLYMTQTRAIALFDIHKSVGIILFVFILWRVLLRINKGWPKDVSTGAHWEHALARIIHWVLILGTIIMPISGMISTYMAGRGLDVFGFEILAANLGDDGKAVAISENIEEIGEFVHEIVGKVLIGAIILHVVGALKHHVMDKDTTLLRMLGKA